MDENRSWRPCIKPPPTAPAIVIRKVKDRTFEVAQYNILRTLFQYRWAAEPKLVPNFTSAGRATIALIYLTRCVELDLQVLIPDKIVALLESRANTKTFTLLPRHLGPFRAADCFSFSCLRGFDLRLVYTDFCVFRVVGLLCIAVLRATGRRRRRRV